MVATDDSRDLHSDLIKLSIFTMQILAACHALVFVDKKTYQNDALFFLLLLIVKTDRLQFIHTSLFGSFCYMPFTNQPHSACDCLFSDVGFFFDETEVVELTTSPRMQFHIAKNQ